MSKRKEKTPKLIHLSQPTALSGSGVTVDRAAGLIKNVAFLSIGPAKGHGFEIDHESLVTTLAGIEANKKSLKTRLYHAELAGQDGIRCIVGRPVNARIVGKQLRGDIQLGTYAKKSPAGNMWDYLLDLAAEDPGCVGLSIVAGFDFEEDGDRLLARTRWIKAIDFTDNPAANPAGMLSHREKPNMAKRKNIEPADLDETDLTTDEGASDGGGDDEGTTNLSEGEPARRQPNKLIRAERRRWADLSALAARHELGEEWLTEAINEGTTLSEAMEDAMEALAAKRPVTSPSKRHITAGEDNRDTLHEAMTDAIALNHGTAIEKPHPRARQFIGLSAIEIARHHLRALGIRTEGMANASVAQLVFNRSEIARRGVGDVALAMGTSDFPLLLGDAMGKHLRALYNQQIRTWTLWARKIEANDFKEQKMGLLSASPTPPVVLEGAEYTFASLDETQEVFRLVKYGQMHKLTWEAMVNDDLRAFTLVSERMARSSAELEEDVAYLPITGNQVMTEDNTALFHANHSNIAAVAAAITVASLGAARAQLAKQRGFREDGDGPILNLQLAHLLVPVAKATEAEQLAASLQDPSKSNDAKNPFFGINVVPQPRLDANSTTAWYGVASHRQCDNAVVAFLKNHTRPEITYEDAFNCDSRTFRLRHCVAGRAIDWRSFVQNTGA